MEGREERPTAVCSVRFHLFLFLSSLLFSSVGLYCILSNYLLLKITFLSSLFYFLLIFYFSRIQCFFKKMIFRYLKLFKKKTFKTLFTTGNSISCDLVSSMLSALKSHSSPPFSLFVLDGIARSESFSTFLALLPSEDLACIQQIFDQSLSLTLSLVQTKKEEGQGEGKGEGEIGAGGGGGGKVGKEENEGQTGHGNGEENLFSLSPSSITKLRKKYRV